jgi:hypothetical protein
LAELKEFDPEDMGLKQYIKRHLNENAKESRYKVEE